MFFNSAVVRLTMITAFFAASVNSQAEIKVSSRLSNAFETDSSGKRNIVLTFKQKPSQVLDMFDMSSRSGGQAGKEAKAQLHKNYLDQLEQMRTGSQEEIIKFLEGKSSEINGHKSFWVSNQLFVKGADKELTDALASFENVESIHQEEIFHIHKPIEQGPVTDESRLAETGTHSLEWNIKKIRAEEAWNSGGGGTKSQQLCTVGVIDTGVRSTHEAFSNVKFLEWKDAVNGEDSPYDDNGHGTHVAGTIAGATGTGVAPGFVNMYACKACDGAGSCTESDITECLEFMTAKKPDVVSNSWGGPGGDSRYASIINAWEALDIAAIFSAGNSGPSCGTVGSPADYLSVISVGSTTSDDSLSDFSSRGQCQSGMLAPTLSAPGSKINSAWFTSDTSYKVLSGTSMAAPHVTGLYALLFSKHPNLTPDQAKVALAKSCTTSGLSDPDQTCGGTTFDIFPNNMFGNGVIDCVNTLKLLNAN